MKVLVADDDKEICQFIQVSLQNRGYHAVVCYDGQDALHLVTSSTYDVCVIDWMLPSLDGVSVIKAMRERHVDTPSIILTAKSHLEDKIKGLHSGCDDYLTKPFAIEELIARLELLYKRVNKQHQVDATHIHFGDLVLDKISHQVRYKNKLISLQAREYKILLFLLQHSSQVITRALLLEHVWEYQFDPQTNIIDVHISRLRNKLADAGLSEFIQTIRGVGYSIKGDENHAI